MIPMTPSKVDLVAKATPERVKSPTMQASPKVLAKVEKLESSPALNSAFRISSSTVRRSLFSSAKDSTERSVGRVHSIGTWSPSGFFVIILRNHGSVSQCGFGDQVVGASSLIVSPLSVLGSSMVSFFCAVVALHGVYVVAP